MIMDKIRFRIWLVLLAVYFVFRLVLTSWLDSLGSYAPYLFEAILVLAAFILMGRSSLAFFKMPKAAAGLALAFLPLGFIAYRAMGWIGIPFPLELSGVEPAIFLLLV